MDAARQGNNDEAWHAAVLASGRAGIAIRKSSCLSCSFDPPKDLVAFVGVKWHMER